MGDKKNQPKSFLIIPFPIQKSTSNHLHQYACARPTALSLNETSIPNKYTTNTKVHNTSKNKELRIMVSVNIL